jgi:hypothetical protein
VNEEQKLRMERDYVANYYGPHAIHWMEQVAGMPREQITAIYLKMKAKNEVRKHLKPDKPDKPEDDLRLF